MTSIRATLGLLLATVVAGAFAVAGSASPRSGDLHVTKDCSQYSGQAGGYCTIRSSSLNAIAPGMFSLKASCRRTRSSSGVSQRLCEPGTTSDADVGASGMCM